MFSTLIRTTVALLTLVFACALFAEGADAATKYSNKSGRWDAAGTWTPSGVPGSSDDVIVMPNTVVTLGNTASNVTYTINSLEVRANARVEQLALSFRTYIRTQNNGPSGYAVLNLGLIHGQLNRTSVIECAGNLKTDGSGITNRTNQNMGGFSWGWNNVCHSGNPWPHNHSGNNGMAAPGYCLLLTGGTTGSPATIEQAAAVNIDTSPYAASLDALPRTYVKGIYRMESDLEINAFESRIELGGELRANGYRLQVQGPLHAGDPGFNSVSYSRTNRTQTFTALSVMTGATGATNNALWTGSATQISYNTMPKKITNAIPSGWTNNQTTTNGTFNYYGQNVRDLWVSLNGWVGFKQSYTSTYPRAYMPVVSEPNGVATPGNYYHQLNNANHHVNWAVIPASYVAANTGLFPGATTTSDRLVIEWVTRYAFSTTGLQFRYQMHLEEDTNKIFFHYGSGVNQTGAPTLTPNWNTSTMTTLIGLEDFSGNNAAVGPNNQTSTWGWSQVEPNNTYEWAPQYAQNPVAKLELGGGTGTSAQGNWPQFRITGGAAVTWGDGTLIEIPNGSNGSAMVGASVNMYGASRIQIDDQPIVPTAMQNGIAPTMWVVGALSLGGSAQVNINVPATPNNPTNSVLQVGQTLDFIDRSTTPATPSSAVVNLNGNNGPAGFPTLLVQGGTGGGLNVVTNSLWAGTPGGTVPGNDTAGMNLTNAVFVHQGGLGTIDSFRVTGIGNPSSLWGPHAMVIGLDQYQWQASTVTVANPTNLSAGGPGTVWDLNATGLFIKGNRMATNGGGGNLFLSSGAKLAQYKRAANLPANGSVGMVDIGGNLQVTGAAEYQFGADTSGTPNVAGNESTLRVLGQGAIPPALGTGPQALRRRAPLGNLSIDDGGHMHSGHASNVLVFIGEKWHSASSTVKVHPWKVTNLISYQSATGGPFGTGGGRIPLLPSGGSATYTFSIQGGGGGTLSGGTGPGTGGAILTDGVAGNEVIYTAPSGAVSGTAIVRCVDANGEMFDAVITYRPKSLGTLSMTPGLWYMNSQWQTGTVTGLRVNLTLKPTITFRAYGGTGNYSWTRTGGNGTLSSTTGAAVTYTTGTSTTATTITLNDGTSTRATRMWKYTSLFGDSYPTPYNFYHLRVGETQQLHINPAAVAGGTTVSWAFQSNPSGAFYTSTGTTTATGTSVTINSGPNGGVTASQLRTIGNVTMTPTGSTTAVTRPFYLYVTALPSDLTVGPTQVDGWLPGQSFDFTAEGGTQPFTFSLGTSGGGSAPAPSVTQSGTGANRIGQYTSGGNSQAADVIELQDSTGISVLATVTKGLATPANGNAFIAVPGAKAIFTNTLTNSVDQLVVTDNNDIMGRVQLLKTLPTGDRVLANAIEISPILLTVVNNTSQTFTASGGAAPYTFTLAPGGSGATIGATSGLYTAGNTANTVDTVIVTDANGNFARSTVNVVTAGGASPLEVRPRYISAMFPGQQIQLRFVGGKGSISWTMLQNDSGGGVTPSGLYTAGSACGGSWVTDRIQISDGSGDFDIVRIQIQNPTWNGLYLWASNIRTDIDTGAGKTRNGLMPGQVVNLTTSNASATSTWSFPSGSASGGTLAGNGRSATWTAGSTGNVTDVISVTSGGTQRTAYYKVIPPPFAVSPSQASVFGGGVLNFTSSGGTGTYTYSITTNSSGATMSVASNIGTYTAGLSPGIDIVRIADASSFVEVAVSVLGAANPTVLNCSQLEIYHGQLDLSGQTVNVIDSGQPNGRGDFVVSHGGVPGANNPELRNSDTNGALNVGRTFVWNPNADENVTAGTITVHGSMNVTENPTGNAFDLNVPGSSNSQVILTGDNPDYPAGSPSRVEVWRATSTGGAPTMAGLSFDALQVGPGATGGQIVRFGTICYTSFATQGPNIPTMETLAGVSIPTVPANNCTPSGSVVPPGFQQWIGTTTTTAGNTPATLPTTTTTIGSGVWITITSGTCWTIPVGATVTVQGGLVIEDGCVDIQGTLIVEGDVFVGVGSLAADRLNAPTLTFSGAGSPRLDVRESSPGTGGTFAFNIGAVANFNQPGQLFVENSLKALEDATNGISFNPANMEVRMVGAGQEAASATSPVSSRLWLADDQGTAQGMTVATLRINKTNTSDLIDINSPITVTNIFDVQSGDVFGTLGNGSVILTGQTWTNGAGANYDNAGGTIGANNWGAFNVYLDGAAATVQDVSASTAVPVPVLPTTRVRHSGTPAGRVRLSSAVTANNWYVLDGRFDPNGNRLTTSVDFTVGDGSANDQTNAPELFMSLSGDAVVAGRHFLFFPGAVETVSDGLLEAGGDFAITDTAARPFNLSGGNSLVRMSGPDVSTGPTTSRPAQIFSQDAGNNPQTLQLNDFEVAANATATVDLMSNVQVNGLFTMVSGTLQGTNGTLLLAGNWTSTGGTYGTFLGGAISITGTNAQTFQSTIPVPPVTITKTGAGIVNLSGSFQTQGDLRLQDGVLNVNGAVLTVNGNFWVGIGIVATDRARAPELRANSAGQSTIRVLSTNTVNGNFNFFGGCVETVTNCILEVQRNVALEEDTNAADPNVSAPTRPIDFFNPITGAGNELRLTGANNGVVFLTDGPLQQNPVTLELEDLTIAKATVNDTVSFTSGVRVNGTYLHTEGTVAGGVIFVDGPTFTVQGGAYNPAVSIVVASPATQTFVSTVTLPQLFINKPGTNPLLVGTGATLQTGNFTIQDGTVDLNGGTLVVNGNFSVGDGSANDPINVPNFILSTTTGSTNGGTLDIQHTGIANGNFQFFNGCTATIDTSTVFASGNVYVNDATFAFTGTNTVEMRNNRGATASLWSDRPVINPVVTMVNLTLNKTPGGTGSQVDIGSDVVVSGVFDVRGNTIVNGTLGTNGPVQLTGTGTVLTTSGTSGSFTAGTAIEVIGTGAQDLQSSFPLGVVIVNKATGTMTVGTGGLQTGVFQLMDGNLDLNGQTLRVNGWMEVGNGTPPGGVTPNLISDGAGDLIQVIAPGSSVADGTLFWFADATGTLTNGQFDIEGNLDVRGTQQGVAVTWAPSGSHKIRMFQNRGSAVTASSTQIPNDPSGSLYQNASGTPLATLVLQDFEIVKSGTTGNGTRVDLNLTDVAVRGLFTLTSGTVNTATGGGAFVLKFEGNSTGTGGSFTPTSWVSYEGLTAQAMGGTGGALPNVQVVKTTGAPGNVLSVNATQQLESLTILDGTFDLQGTGNVTLIGGMTVGVGGNGTLLAANQAAAPEFRMSTSGSLSIGGNFAFWAGSVETINGGTINLTGNLALEEDSSGPKFDLSASTALFNFTGGTAAQIFLQDELGAAQTLELWDVTVSKNSGITATVSGPVEVYGAFTMQSGTLATTGFGVVSLRGNWNHTGGTYATGTRMQLTGGATQTLQAAGGVLPSITIDKTGGVAQVNTSSTVQIGAPSGGELFWVKRGTFDLNGGTLQVNGIAFVGDNSGAAVTPVPTLLATTAGSLLDVNATTQPPTGFFVDGDFVLQHNGPNPTSVVTLTTGALQVEHRLAIDHSAHTTAPLAGAGFALQLDGNAGGQGAGEIFNLQGTLVVTDIEVAKTGGSLGAQARTLGRLDVRGDVLVTSGALDLSNQARLDVLGDWTVASAGSVTPTITQVWFGGNTASTITVNSGAADFFDLVVDKAGAGDQVILTSTAVPAQPVVAQRQLLIRTGEVVVSRQLTVGANPWVGNLLVGVNGVTANPGDATLEIQSGATVALGSAAQIAVDVNGVLEQVGTNAASRARLTSISAGAAQFGAMVNGVWRAQWYEVSGLNQSGVVFGGTASAPAPAAGQALADGLWDYPAAGGIFIDLSNGPAGLPLAVYRNSFNNSGSITTNGNVQATASTATILFLNATGTEAGEANDLEPGAGPAPVYWNAATVLATLAGNNPAAANVLAGTNQHPLASFALTETSAGEAADLSGVTVTFNTTTNLATITLWIDADGSGTVTGGDLSLGTAGTVTATTAAWAGSPLLSVASGGSLDLLVTADISAAATGSYTASLASSGALTGTGGLFGLNLQVSGAFALNGGTQTVVASGALTAALGTSSPAAGNIVANSQVTMGQWLLTAGPLENHTITGLTFDDNMGFGLTATEISGALVAVDVNGNGVYEAGIDTLLASATGPVYTGTAVTLSGFNRVVTAGTSVNIIFVQTFTNAVSAVAPDQYRTRLTGITSTGVTSSNASTVSGLPSQSTVQTVATAGSLDVALGGNNPATTAVVRTATNAVMGQIRVQISQAEGLTVSQVVVTNAGTGATTNVTQVRLILDANNNGAVDASDTTLGSAALTGSTATITLSRAMAASTIEHWIVAYDLAAPVSELGNSHEARLNAGAISGTGQVSTNALVLTGAPVSGGSKLLTDGIPTLTATAGANNPSAGSVPASSASVVLAQPTIAATGEDQTITAVQVSLSGTANDVTAVSGLYLYDDVNGDGVAQGGELLAGPLTLATDNGSVTFGGLSRSITNGNSMDLLVVADFSAPGVQSGDTITATITTLTAAGNTSSVTSSVTGIPFAGPQLTLAVPGTLIVTAGPRMPTAQTVPSGTIAVPVWQAALTANNTEDLLVTGVTLQQTGGTAGVFGAVRLYWDGNANGLLDAGDVAISSVATLTGTPAQVAWTMGQRISAGTTQHFLAVADIAGSLGQTGDVGVATGGLTIQGLTSGLTEINGLGLTGLPQTGGTVTVGASGSVTVYVGTNTSPSRTEPAGTTTIAVTQLTLRASVAEAATVGSLTVTHFGTGVAADVSQLQLYEDLNGNGRVDAGETSVATATLAGAPATATFSSLGTLTVPAGGDLHLVVAYDLASGAAPGATFRTQVFANSDITVTGQTTSTALPVAGAPVMGNQLTVGTAEQLLVNAGSPWPSTAYLPPATLPATNVPVATLHLEATAGQVGVDVGSLTLWPSGTGNDAQVTVNVWDESTGTTPGVVDGGDTLLGTSAGYPGDNQPWTMSLTPAVRVNAGTSTQWLVTYTVPAGTAYNSTFEVRLLPASDVSATEVTGGAGATVTGPALQGATLTVAVPPTTPSPVAFSSGSSGGGCFIATAAAGYDSSLVTGLVHGRDTLLPEAIVSGYYRTSPPVAAAVAGHPGAAAGVRGGLTPFAGWAGQGSVAALLMLLMLAGLAVMVTRRRRVVAGA